MGQEPTNAEILKAITEGQKHTDGRIDDILEAVNDFSTKMDEKVDKLDGGMDKLETDVTAIKATMVDKDYLDRALAKQKGDIILTMRKGDIKLRELITIMHGKQMLTDTEVQHLITMEPFAQLSV